MWATVHQQVEHLVLADVRDGLDEGEGEGEVRARVAVRTGCLVVRDGLTSKEPELLRVKVRVSVTWYPKSQSS